MHKLISQGVHVKCRGKFYPIDKIQRIVFADDLVPWSVPFVQYAPNEYNSPHLVGKPWADPPINAHNFHPKWNSMDGTVNRISYPEPYTLDVENRPLNTAGRTGLRGRGILGRWGPNHAADPIVTRWKRDSNGAQQLDDAGRPVLQVILIERRDCHEWALPGGMVDAGELITTTLRREFMEEALNVLEKSESEASADGRMIERFFAKGVDIYRGYVDDPRNTDNAWMETVAVNFHDANGQHVGKFDLAAGDDAQSVKWMDVDNKLELYASHAEFVWRTAEVHGAHWD